MHALGRGRVGTKSTVATLVPGFEKCQEEWKYFLDDKEKIIGAWGLAHSRLSPNIIKEAQICMCAETDSTGIPDVLCGTGYGAVLELLEYAGVGASGLQGSIGTTAKREQKWTFGRGGLNRLRSPKQEVHDDDAVSQRYNRGPLYWGQTPWGPLSGP